MDFMVDGSISDIRGLACALGGQYSQVCEVDDRAACANRTFRDLSPPAKEAYSAYEQIRHRMAYEVNVPPMSRVGRSSPLICWVCGQECVMGVLPSHLLDRSVFKGMRQWRKCQAKHPSVALAILMACFPCRAVEDDVLSGIARLYHATAPYKRMPYSRGKDGGRSHRLNAPSVFAPACLLHKLY